MIWKGDPTIPEEQAERKHEKQFLNRQETLCNPGTDQRNAR